MCATCGRRALSAAVAGVLGFIGTAHSADIHVPGDVPTIQEAIDGALPFDVVIVSPGVYAEHVNLRGKWITLRSEDPTNPAIVATTIIDAADAGTAVECTSAENPLTRVAGFTLIRGNAPMGGGMFINAASPIVTNCVFVGCEAGAGAGIAIGPAGAPTIVGCTFLNNSAWATSTTGCASWATLRGKWRYSCSRPPGRWHWPACFS